MKKRTRVQQATYQAFVADGWEFLEEMPYAGVIAMRKSGYVISIKRSGAVIKGNLCDKFRR